METHVSWTGPFEASDFAPPVGSEAAYELGDDFTEINRLNAQVAMDVWKDLATETAAYNVLPGPTPPLPLPTLGQQAFVQDILDAPPFAMEFVSDYEFVGIDMFTQFVTP